MEIKNFDKLVNLVTENVIRQIDSKPSGLNHEKTCLILFPNYCFSVFEFMRYIRAKYNQYNYIVCVNESHIDADEIKQLTNVKTIIYGDNLDCINYVNISDILIVIGLQINEMTSLSQLDDTSQINRMITGRLLVNKQVEILLNSNSKLYGKIEELLGQLNALGIIVSNINSIQYGYSKHIVDGYQDKGIKDDSLITERKIQTLYESGIKKLLLHRNQIMTPLAKDKISELKIDYRYDEEE